MSLEETTSVETVDAPAVADSAPSTDVDYRTMSDDQILDLSEDSNAEKPAAQDEGDSKTPSEAKPAADTEQEEKPEKAKKEDELEEDYEPESIKALYARPELKVKLDAIFKAHPEVRSAWFRSAQVAELFPTVAEARELRSLYPTVEGAKMAANAAAVLTKLDQAYVEDPKTFVTNLSRGNPEAFSTMLQEARSVLYQQDPVAYARDFADPVALDLMHNALQRAQADGDEALQAALEIVQDRFNFPTKGAGKPAAPEDPRIRQFERMKQEATEARAQTIDAFASRADQAYWDGLDKAVSDAIGKPAAMSPGALARLKAEVRNDITNELAKRIDLQPQYERYKRSGDTSDEHLQRVSNFLLNYAKSYVGKAVRTRMGEWTSEILNANKEELEKVAAKPKNKDVGAGSGQSGAPSKGSGKIDYRKVSDDQILNGNY